MKIIEKPLPTWNAFEEEIKASEAELKRLHNESEYEYSEPIYRGQNIANWSLCSSLERLMSKPLPADNYIRMLEKARRRLNGVQENRWPKEAWETVSYQKLRDGSLPYFRFMAYLRHHNFPTPLLDWSRSAFVAAFFAFRDKPANDEVAIWRFVEEMGSGRTDFPISPHYIILGKDDGVHPRHFAQQSVYTVCAQLVDSDKVQFASHIPNPEDHVYTETPQLELTKFLIPATERPVALTALKRMNITPFSLFGSEDSLIHTLSLEILEFPILGI